MKAKVNDRFSYDLNQLHQLEVIEHKGASYRIRLNARVYQLELIHYEPRKKWAQIAVEGYVFEVNLQDELDDTINMLRQISFHVSGNEELLAPIPGLIKKVIKEEGTAVKEGDALLILEAMKMENTIQAPLAADMVQYHVEEGDHVVKGQILVSLKVS